MSPKQPRRRKTDDRERYCAQEDCPTKLSRYNTTGDYCWAHAPRKMPRIRGRYEK